MGNWLNGLHQYANANGFDTRKEISAAFRAGVEWGRKDMLQHAIILMQETHDLCVERNEQIDGYEMARELVHDWTPSNAKVSRSAPLLAQVGSTDGLEG